MRIQQFVKTNSGEKDCGFTLIELLIVIVIIASLAVTIFVALNPVKRLADSRDARRRTDVESILTAIHEYFVDNAVYPAGLSTGMTEKQIGTCGTCVNLTSQLSSYLSTIPMDPKSGTTSQTGYTVVIDSNGIVGIKSLTNEDYISFFDNFNRPDSASLGSSWTKSTDGTLDFQIVSNMIKLTTADGTNAQAAYTTFGITYADYSVQADITFPNTTQSWVSVMGRGTIVGAPNTNGYYAFVTENGASSFVQLWKRVNATWTSLTGISPQTITPGMPYTVKLMMSGSNIYLYLNGSQILSATDTTFTAPGFAGIANGTPVVAGVTWNNFTILPSIQVTR